MLVLLDRSAAFDTIDHGKLLGRLSCMGVGSTILRWVHSLSGRSSKVVLGDYLFSIIYGVSRHGFQNGVLVIIASSLSVSSLDLKVGWLIATVYVSQCVV